MRSPDLAIVTGFGDKGLDTLKQELVKKLAPKSITIIASVPNPRALEPSETIIERVGSEIKAINSNNLVAAGHSFGGLALLAGACRQYWACPQEMAGISKLFFIDGPLNSHPVHPATDFLKNFSDLYEYRPKLTKECEEILQKIRTSGMVSIAGKNDRIVPFEAKLLVGDFDTVLLKDDSNAEAFQLNGRGANVVLPDQYVGHDLENRVTIVSTLIMRSLGPQLTTGLR